jgi:hypothetical protein
MAELCARPATPRGAATTRVDETTTNHASIRYGPRLAVPTPQPSPMNRATRTTPLFLLALFAQACAASPCAAAPRHDEPVSPDEPRAVLTVKLDLPKSASCEESFDLALYENRAIDRIEWEGPVGKCAGRQARIRYLSKRIGRDDLIKTVQKHATKAEVLP